MTVNELKHKNLITALQLALASNNVEGIRSIVDGVSERGDCTARINASKVEAGAMALMAALDDEGARMEGDRFDGLE